MGKKDAGTRLGNFKISKALPPGEGLGGPGPILNAKAGSFYGAGFAIIDYI